MNSDWLLSNSTNKFVPNASISIDRLALYINERDFDTYRLLRNKASLNCNEKEFLKGFSQILAHESYHVYQTLSSRVMSDYSVSKRREALVTLRIIQEVANSGNKIQQSELGLSDILDEPIDELTESYFYFIKNDRNNSKHELNASVKTNDTITTRDVIEGSAVAFQLLSQNDVFNTTVALDGSVYTKAWDAFLKSHKISTNIESEMKFYRTVFLYLSDIYLKSFNHPSFSQESFSESIEMMAEILELEPIIRCSFDDYNLRESKFLRALSNVERSETSNEIIIDFCGTLDEANQRQLFFHVCLYEEIFKLIAPVGFPTASRTWLKNNKQQSINHAMEGVLPYWKSDFAIPCILSASIEISKFLNLWDVIDECHFIDDTRNARISVLKENRLLELYDALAEQAFYPSSEGYRVNCCEKHGFMTILGASGCKEKHSLNSRFRELTGKNLEEVIESV